MKKKAAIYCRVSKDDASSDGKLQDPNNQLIPCKKFCEAMDWEVKAIHIDRASGGNSNRPAFQEMLSHVRQRHYDIILVWALDRFSREGITNTMSYIRQLKKYKTDLKSYTEQWIDTSQEGITEVMLAIMSWVGAEERKKISERTKAGLAKLKAKGIKLGRPSGIDNPKVMAVKDEILERLSKGERQSKLSREYQISVYTIKKLKAQKSPPKNND